MDLALLIDLQNIDNEIKKLESSLGDLPIQVEQLSSKLASFKDELSQKDDQLKKCSEDKRKLEGKIELLAQKLKKYREQVYSVTTNKEYDAISAEIEITEKLIEEDETNMLQLLEQEDELTKSIKHIEDLQSRLKVEFENKLELLNQKTEENKHELSTLLEQRRTFVAKIAKPIYSNYERIRKRHNGMALAAIKNYTCAGCFATIPAQTVVEVRKMDNLIHCETCGRILINMNNTINSK